MGLKKLIYTVLIVTQLGLLAQTKDYQEEVHLSFNSTNVLVGETIHFSAFVYSTTTKKLSKLSSVLYVELIDHNGRSKFQTKIGLRNGRGAGSIYISPELLSNTYRIVAYTRWMKNYESYTEQSILVFNPYNGLIRNDSIIGNPKMMNSHLLNDVTVFEPMTAVSIDLGTIEPSSLAIGIRKSTNFYYPNSVELKTPNVSIDSYALLPEFRYAMIQGQLSNSSNELDDVRVNMTVKGSGMQVATTTTDDQGRFWMNFNPELSISNGEVQLQIEDENIEDISIIEEFYDTYPTASSEKFRLDSVQVSELIDRSVNSQIQKAYQEQTPNESKSRKPYVNQKATVYYLDDYTRFSSTRDTFIELATFVGVSKNKDNYKMVVRCEPVPGMVNDDYQPLFLLDGLSVTSADILNQSPNTIEKIEVLPTYYFVNDIVYAGIVSVHSFEGKDFDYTPLGKTFPITDTQPYVDRAYEVHVNNSLPSYEPNLYWDPVYTHQGGPLQLDFSTSRLEGSYILTISGITRSGKTVNLTRHFNVKSSSN